MALIHHNYITIEFAMTIVVKTNKVRISHHFMLWRLLEN